MSQQKTDDHYLDSTDAARRGATGATTGGATGAAMAQVPWDEAKSNLSPFEEKLSTLPSNFATP